MGTPYRDDATELLQSTAGWAPADLAAGGCGAPRNKGAFRHLETLPAAVTLLPLSQVEVLLGHAVHHPVHNQQARPGRALLLLLGLHARTGIIWKCSGMTMQERNQHGLDGER